MAVSGVSSQTSLLVQQLLAQQSSSSKQEAYSGTASSQTQSQDAAYQLALGQQQIDQSLLGYGKLGKLVRQADDAITDMERRDLKRPRFTDADGNLTGRTYNINVKQLALGQQIASAGYPDSTTTSLGTGTLTIAADNGKAVDITITDGTLDGIAKSINDAATGISAKVIQGADGKYTLQLTGPTGAVNTFTLSGIDALAYDQTSDAPQGMTLSQAAQDALYSVNGGNMQSSADNQATVADGITANLTATGAMKVKIPYGYDQISDAATTLTDSLNRLMSNIDTLTGDSGLLTTNGDTAKALKELVMNTLTQSFSAHTSPSSLADVGITQQSDGALGVDSSTLQQAFVANPDGVSKLLSQFVSAVHDSLTSSGTNHGNAVSQQVAHFTGQLTQKMSLIDFLYPSDSSDGDSAFRGILNS